MKRAFPTFFLFVLTLAAVRLSAQVNPYKDGTPGVTGYRSEVIAEVMVQEDKFARLAEAIQHVGPGRFRAFAGSE